MKELQPQRKGKKDTLTSLQLAFTLIEVLLVVAIIVLLSLALLFNYQRHLMRSRDAVRKSDLTKIKLAFEEYYNDHGCYPPPHMLSQCGTVGGSGVGDPDDPDYLPHLYPYYLKSIPCDPLTHEPYFYQSLNGSYCRGYRLLAKLEIDTDSDITGVGCDAESGCDPELGSDYNWGIAVGGSVTGTDWETGGEGEAEGLYYCVPTRIAGQNYTCSILEFSERSTYFVGGCQVFDTESACAAECSYFDEELPAGVSCDCAYGLEDECLSAGEN